MQLKSEGLETQCTLEGLFSPCSMTELEAVAHRGCQQQKKVAKDVIASLGKDQKFKIRISCCLLVFHQSEDERWALELPWVRSCL